MKKLKLKSLPFAAEEVLSREQLKLVLGGDGSSGSDGSAYGCREGTSCRLVLIGSDGSSTYRDGTCDYSYASHKCYCDVGLGAHYEVTSNGGVSRCVI